MLSALKSETARLNGARSHGPTTPEGRARSSQNATRHGLTAASVLVLQTESREQFEAFREGYLLELAPRNQLEADLVEQYVAARWRLQRTWAMEAGLLNVEIMKQEAEIQRDFESISTETRTALAFKSLADNSRALELLRRYETRYERICQVVLETLSRLRKELPNEPTPEENTVLPAPEPAPVGQALACGGTSVPPEPPEPPEKPPVPPAPAGNSALPS